FIGESIIGGHVPQPLFVAEEPSRVVDAEASIFEAFDKLARGHFLERRMRRRAPRSVLPERHHRASGEIRPKAAGGGIRQSRIDVVELASRPPADPAAPMM